MPVPPRPSQRRLWVLLPRKEALTLEGPPTELPVFRTLQGHIRETRLLSFWSLDFLLHLLLPDSGRRKERGRGPVAPWMASAGTPRGRK